MNKELAQILPVDPEVASATAVIETYIQSYKIAFESEIWSILDRYHSDDIDYRFIATNVSKIHATGSRDVISAMQLLKASLTQMFRVKRLGDKYSSVTLRKEDIKVNFRIRYYQHNDGLISADVSRTIWLNQKLQVKKIVDRLSSDQAFQLLKFMSENKTNSQAFSLP